MPVQVARSLPPPTGKIPVVVANATAEPINRLQTVEPAAAVARADDPTGEITRLLRPLLSNQ
jgi:hypothetical protein